MRIVIYDRGQEQEPEIYWRGVRIRVPDRVEIEIRPDQLLRNNDGTGFISEKKQ